MPTHRFTLAFHDSSTEQSFPLRITAIPYRSGYHRLKLINVMYPYKNAPVTSGVFIIQVEGASNNTFYFAESGESISYSWAIPFVLEAEKAVWMYDSTGVGSDVIVFNETSCPIVRFVCSSCTITPP